MKIKKFTAPGMREALLQIRQELGEDAVILRTRKLPRKLLSLGAQDEIEVTAAIDEAAVKQPVAPLRVSAPAAVDRRPERLQPAYPSYTPVSRPDARSGTRSAARRPSPVEEPAPELSDAQSAMADGSGETLQYLELKESVKDIRMLISTILKDGGTGTAGGFTGGWALLYERLVESEVKPESARSLIEHVRKGRETLEVRSEKDLIEILGREFPVSGPVKLSADRPVVMAFVGPTGAGKTTTIAKLAAHLCLNKNKQVGIITADTYRIAAIEQVRVFADIMGIGLQVVFSPDEIPRALESCENDDAVFVDTGGRSQKNAAHMRELEAFLGVLKPDETHLVLSAATKESDLLDVIRRYEPLGVNRLVFSKLDETASLGNVFNAVAKTRIPVSYFTTGQSIPDDIELAQSARFLRKLWVGAAC